MSKGASHSNVEIQSVTDLASWLQAGSTDRKDLLIGSEHEKLIVSKQGHSAAFKGESGLEAFLKDMTGKGWAPIFENGHLIELKKDTATLSLEPAGQVEHSTLVHQSIHSMALEIEEQIDDAVKVAEDVNLNLVALGYQPIQGIETLPRVPKARYQNFDTYFRGLSSDHQKGLRVMYATASTQANLGYEDESDMVKKMRVALSLQPIVTALYANSPFENGKLSGLKSVRSRVVHNAVNGRYGFMLPVAFEEGFGFERFADFALRDMPLIGVYNEDHFVGLKGATFSDFMDGKIEVCKTRKVTLNDWENHLNCIWPEVRLRQFIEMRGADAVPCEMIKALPALWVGLLYDPVILDQAYEMVRNWSHEDREYLRLNVPVQALDLPFLGTNVQEIAKNMLSLAHQGLVNRNVLNGSGVDESHFLNPLHEIAESGLTWSDRLIAQYETEWNNDVSAVFNAMSYKNMPSVLSNKAMALTTSPIDIAPLKPKS